MDLRGINTWSRGRRALATVALALVLLIVSAVYIRMSRPGMDEAFAYSTASRMRGIADRLDVSLGIHTNAVTVGWIDLNASLFLASGSAARSSEARQAIADVRQAYRASLDVWQASLADEGRVPVSSVEGLDRMIADDPQLAALVSRSTTDAVLSNGENRAVSRIWQRAAERLDAAISAWMSW
jgi:hypothetical protein